MVRITSARRDSSTNTDILDKNLALARKKFGRVVKDKTGPFGLFASLSSLVQASATALAEHGVTIQQYYAANDDYSMTLITELACQGQFKLGTIKIPPSAKGNPQHIYAYCTYMRRLAYASMLGLAADEDSDGAGVTPSDNAPDMDAIKAAIRATKTPAEIDELWGRICDLSLSREALAELDAEIQAHKEARKKRPTNADK